MCTDVCVRDACVSVHACTFQLHVYLDLEWLLPASQPPPPSVLLTAEPVCRGERLGKHVGKSPEEQEGDPACLPDACLLPACLQLTGVSWCGASTQKYDTFNICFGLVCVCR